MGTTQWFGLAFFDFGEPMDSALSVEKERSRFILIDNQLYGLYNVFGNGVINGWEVTDNTTGQFNNISVRIAPGIGIINFLAAQSSTTFTVDHLSPNSTVFIYATLTGSTVVDRVINFTQSIYDSSSPSLIKLAKVVTTATGISLIDSDVRDLISFEALIQEQENAHKHRGTPSKIDLATETKNQLPGSKIESIDASQVASGVFDINRIPVIDHDDLSNNGLLSHAALDTFAMSLSQNNKQLLGEIATVNLMKHIIFMKYKYADVDDHFINELALIPGISPDSFIDFDASSPDIVDLVNQCIHGKTVRTGNFTSVYWDNDIAFLNAAYSVNVVVANDTVTLARDSMITYVIDNFNGAGVVSPGQDIPGFTKTMTLIEDDLSLKFAGGDSEKTEGYYGGKFDTTRKYRAVFTKEIPEDKRDWTDYSEFLLYVKTLTNTHLPVYVYWVNGEGVTEAQSPVWTVLETDEQTDTGTNNNFKEFKTDISGVARNDVRRFVIYTDDTAGDFYFYLDNIYVRHINLTVPQGTIRFRHSSASEVTFHSLCYHTATPTATDIQVRAKVANSPDLLARTPYSLPLRSGETFATNGTDIEIEVTLMTTDYTLTSTLYSLELKMLVTADFQGYDVPTHYPFSSGELMSNIVINTDTSVERLKLLEPINVGGKSFATRDNINEMNTTKVAILGIAGSKMPISPNQAKTWNNNISHKFNELNSAIRKYNKDFIVADRSNHRVVQVDKNQTLVRGFGSVTVTDTTFYPMTSCYNSLTGVLTIVFSKGVTASTAVLTKIDLYVGSNKYTLDENDIILSGETSAVRKNTQIFEIRLAAAKQVRLSGVTSDVFVNVNADAFPLEIDFADDATNLLGVKGIECFIGDFTYMDGIHSPIFANILTNGNWVVGNSFVNYDPSATTSTVPTMPQTSDPACVLEFDPDDLSTVFSSGLVRFSDYSLGSIVEYETNKLLVAGIAVRSSPYTPPLTGTQLLASTPSAMLTDRVRFRAAAIDALVGYSGIVTIIDKTTGGIVFTYHSPDGMYASDAAFCTRPADNGSILITESTFGVSSGRITKIDNFGNINWVVGSDGTFNIINDAHPLLDGHTVVSI